jgi:hypothetical protein
MGLNADPDGRAARPYLQKVFANPQYCRLWQNYFQRAREERSSAMWTGLLM